MANDVFLSYRRTDQALARELVGALEARGLEVWWDQEIEGGEDWREAIVEGLSSSRALVILFSENCNASKQLKKELAIADTLDKEVIPVLIEDTKPKGHYLYELAARNWLQIHPNPETKIDNLADRLARELSDAPSAAAAPTPEIVGSAPGRESMMDASPPGGFESAPPPQARAETPPLPAETVEKVVEATRKQASQTKDRRDFMPFKWYEIVVVLALAGVMGFVQQDPALQIYDALFFGALLLLSCAALVFPIRYYFRRRRVGRAVRFYFLSTIPLALLMAIAVTIHADPELANADQFGEGLAALAGAFAINFIVALIVLIGLSIISFGIYGLLHFQRTMRNFNKNVEAL